MLYVNKKLAYCIYALGVIIGLARVAGGVHYPSDIVGGAVLGICTGYIVVKAWKYLSRYVAIPAI
jgi:membrane-associated phospholipid phosphatase